MKVIGLTGGSGSGKSVAASFLASRGGMVIDADAVYHRLISKKGRCTRATSFAPTERSTAESWQRPFSPPTEKKRFLFSTVRYIPS